MGIFVAADLTEKSWLHSRPDFDWFVRGYSYARNQTRAIEALSSCSPEAMYSAVWAIMHGAGLPDPEETAGEPVSVSPDYRDAPTTNAADVLTNLAIDWICDADVMRCRHCRRDLHVSYANDTLRHAFECPVVVGLRDVKPWLVLRDALRAPVSAAPSPAPTAAEAQRVDMHSAEMEAMADGRLRAQRVEDAPDWVSWPHLAEAVDRVRVTLQANHPDATGDEQDLMVLKDAAKRIRETATVRAVSPVVPVEREPDAPYAWNESSLLADNVKSRRKARGWTQAALATKCGMVQPRIAEMEAGTSNPTVTTLAQVASALECLAADLIRIRPDQYEVRALLHQYAEADRALRDCRAEDFDHLFEVKEAAVNVILAHTVSTPPVAEPADLSQYADADLQVDQWFASLGSAAYAAEQVHAPTGDSIAKTWRKRAAFIRNALRSDAERAAESKRIEAERTAAAERAVEAFAAKMAGGSGVRAAIKADVMRHLRDANVIGRDAGVISSKGGD